MSGLKVGQETGKIMKIPDREMTRKLRLKQWDWLIVYMGGRLPAVAGMPANRTFLELSAGQSDWPEKNCVVLLPKKRRRPVLFPHEKRFSLWTAPCLGIKSGVYRVTYATFRLPSLIVLWPLHYPTSDLVETRQPIKEHNIVPEKAGVNEYSGWRHTMARSLRHCGWLTCMEITIFIAEVTTVYHGPLDCVSWLLCLSRRYKVFQANILMLYI